MGQAVIYKTVTKKKKIEKRELHRDLIAFLKSEKYSGFVSIEMGLTENLSDLEQDFSQCLNVQEEDPVPIVERKLARTRKFFMVQASILKVRARVRF